MKPFSIDGQRQQFLCPHVIAAQTVQCRALTNTGILRVGGVGWVKKASMGKKGSQRKHTVEGISVFVRVRPLSAYEEADGSTQVNTCLLYTSPSPRDRG